ncbi:MAG: dihydroxy-acid dehydratase, partial [Rhizobiales bacterium]|nr:dihydroxy-acid dehydratase [Hyphomicrobiales bacterium]
TMGTASTMNSLSEVLGMQLPGGGTIPAPYRERGQLAYKTGKRIVDLVIDDVRPSDIMTREAFENVIVVNSALGGSTNAPIHITAIAKHIGIDMTIDDWEKHGLDVPLLVNLQPAGKYLAEDFHRAGGVQAVIAELMKHGHIHEDVLTVSGDTIGNNCRNQSSRNHDVIRSFENALMHKAGFKVIKGNLFDAAIIKLSVVSDEFRQRLLNNPDDPNAFEGIATVFDGPEIYHATINDPALNITEKSILFMRGAGAIGFPGAAEVVNMQVPDYLLKKGVKTLPCIGDGRQSGTSGSPSILNASPEAAIGGGLAILRNGDKVRIDLNKGEANILIPAEELAERFKELEAAGGFKYPESQTPWQEIQRGIVGQLSEGMVLKNATKYQDLARTKGVPRDSH